MIAVISEVQCGVGKLWSIERSNRRKYYENVGRFIGQN